MYLGRNLSWGMEASCCWFSPQNRINIQNKNQKLLFEHAGPQGEHCHVLFLTQWHLHTLLPNAIHLPDISSSRFHYSPHHFCLSCFQISHSFLAIRPFPFLFSITPCPLHTLYLSVLPSIPLPPLMWRGCGRLITAVQLGESKRAVPGRPEGRMKEGWEGKSAGRGRTQGGSFWRWEQKKREREREGWDRTDFWRWFPTVSFAPSSEGKQITDSSTLKCTCTHTGESHETCREHAQLIFHPTKKKKGKRNYMLHKKDEAGFLFLVVFFLFPWKLLSPQTLICVIYIYIYVFIIQIF